MAKMTSVCEICADMGNGTAGPGVRGHACSHAPGRWMDERGRLLMSAEQQFLLLEQRWPHLGTCVCVPISNGDLKERHVRFQMQVLVAVVTSLHPVTVVRAAC